MADKGNSNWLWWSIGSIATLGLGLGIYYFVKSKRETEIENKQNDVISQPLPASTPSVAPTPSPAPIAETITLKSTPFTSIEQSNAFRKWVNEKDPAFAQQIDLDASVNSVSSMNNSTIQKAWGKYSNQYYTENSESLGFLMQSFTGANPIQGGVIWKSVDATPRGEVFMYTDGKITANAVNAQGQKTKFVQGGWYKNGFTYHIMIGGANYDVLNLNLKNVFWSILKKAEIYNDSTNSYLAFNSNVGMTNFGLVTDGTLNQDEVL